MPREAADKVIAEAAKRKAAHDNGSAAKVLATA
jgi:hypothetical protein